MGEKKIRAWGNYVSLYKWLGAGGGDAKIPQNCGFSFFNRVLPVVKSWQKKSSRRSILGHWPWNNWSFFFCFFVSFHPCKWGRNWNFFFEGCQRSYEKERNSQPCRKFSQSMTHKPILWLPAESCQRPTSPSHSEKLFFRREIASICTQIRSDLQSIQM